MSSDERLKDQVAGKPDGSREVAGFASSLVDGAARSLKGALPSGYHPPLTLFPDENQRSRGSQNRHQDVSGSRLPGYPMAQAAEKTRILALDLGTSCGYAYSYAGTAVLPERSGVFDLAPKRFEGGGMRFLRFTRHLEELRPTVVFFEEVRRHLGTDAAHIYGGLLAHLQAYCEHHHVPYSGIPVATIKKRATGKGNARKEAMLEAALSAFGPGISSFDQADALWILQCGLDLLHAS